MPFDRFIRAAAARSRVIDLEESERTRAILRFQLPLGVTAIIMASTFTVVNAGLARTISPEAALAAFALAQSATNLFASPLWSTRNLILTLATDRVSVHNAIRLTIVLTVLLSAWMGVLAFTPVGPWIYSNVFGAPADLLPAVMDVVRLCLVLPIIYALRGWGQAIVLIHRRTPLLMVAMIVRLAVMLPMAVLLPGTGLFSPTGVGAAIWVVGMALESLVCVFFGRRLMSLAPERIPFLDDPGVVTSVKDAIRFQLPLIAHAYVSAMTFPIINAALARSMNPQMALAGFQVAWSLAFLFVAFVHPNMEQTVMVFLESGRWWQVIRRVGLWIILSDVLLFVLFIMSGGASWILLSVIGVTPTLLPVVRIILLITAGTIFFGGVVDMWVGVATKMRRTPVVGLAKAADVLVVALVAFGSIAIWPHAGGYIAPIALTMGLAANLGVLYRLVPIEVPQTRKPR